MNDQGYDFSGLTDQQQALILHEGWRIGQKHLDGSAWVQPHPRTVKKLIERGLMDAVESVEMGGPFRMTVMEYRVPLHVHMAYCAWCAKQEVA